MDLKLLTKIEALQKVTVQIMKVFERVNLGILMLLAVLLVLGSFVIGWQAWKRKDGRAEYLNRRLLFFLSMVLLFAATIHVATALCSNGDLNIIKTEIIAAVLMSAFSITLVLLHKGIERFMKGDIDYGWSEVLLVTFVTTGGIFMVGTIYLIIP